MAKTKVKRESLSLEQGLRDALKARAAVETLRYIASKTGISDGQLVRFLSGERTLHLPTASILADYLGLRLQQFAAATDVTNRKPAGQRRVKVKDSPIQGAIADVVVKQSKQKPK